MNRKLISFILHPSSFILSYDPRPKAEIVNRCAGQLAAQLFEQLALVKVRQLLQQYGVINQHFQHTAAQAVDARVLRRQIASGHGIGPGLLQAQPILPPTPAARSEQAAEDFAQEFGAFIHFRFTILDLSSQKCAETTLINLKS